MSRSASAIVTPPSHTRPNPQWEAADAAAWLRHLALSEKMKASQARADHAAASAASHCGLGLVCDAGVKLAEADLDLLREDAPWHAGQVLYGVDRPIL